MVVSEDFVDRESLTEDAQCPFIHGLGCYQMREFVKVRIASNFIINEGDFLLTITKGHISCFPEKRLGISKYLKYVSSTTT